MQVPDSTTPPVPHDPLPHAAAFRGARTLQCILDTAGNLLEANETFLALADCALGELQGRPLWSVEWLADESSSGPLREAVARAAGGTSRRVALRVLDGDGLPRTLDLELRPLRDANGKIAFLHGDGLDATPAQHSREVQATLERAFEAMGTGASLLAHEIKNPQTSVHLSLRAVAAQLGIEQVEVIEELGGKLQNLERLIRRTFSCVRPLEAQLLEFEVLDLVEHAMQRRNVNNPAAPFDAPAAPAALRVHADQALIVDALCEVLHNAEQATGEAGRVRVNAGQRDGFAWIRIEDDGPGVPAQLQERLFQPFVSGSPNNAGLGLAIARRNIELCGGTLELLNNARSGACFELQLSQV